LAGWGTAVGLSLAAFTVIAGLLLVESALVGWDRVPFACTHQPDPETVRTRWILYLLPFIVFSFAGAALQLVALRSALGTAAYLRIGLTIAAALLRWSERQTAHGTLQYYPRREHAAQTLNLSEALH